MTDLEALAAKVAELEARLAAATPPPPEPALPVVIRQPYSYTPPPTKGFAYVIPAPEFRGYNARGVRQLAVAVAVSRGEPLPGPEVPTSYEAPMKRLAECRSRGLTWRASLLESGLEVPDDGEIAFQAREIRDALPRLWDGVSDLLGRLEQRLPNWVFSDLKKNLLRCL